MVVNLNSKRVYNPFLKNISYTIGLIILEESQIDLYKINKLIRKDNIQNVQ